MSAMDAAWSGSGAAASPSLTRSLPGLALFVDEHGNPLNMADRYLPVRRPSPSAVRLAWPPAECSIGTSPETKAGPSSECSTSSDLHAWMAPSSTSGGFATMGASGGSLCSPLGPCTGYGPRRWPQAPPLPLGPASDTPAASSSTPTRRTLLAALEAVAPLSSEQPVERSMPSSSAWMLLQDVRATALGGLEWPGQLIRQRKHCCRPSESTPSAMRDLLSNSSAYDAPLTPLQGVSPLRASPVPALASCPRVVGASSVGTPTKSTANEALVASPTVSDIEAALESMPTPPRCLELAASPSVSTPPSGIRASSPPLSLVQSVGSGATESDIHGPPPAAFSRCTPAYSGSTTPSHAISCASPVQKQRRRSFSLAAARDQFKLSVGASARSNEFRRARLQMLDAISNSPLDSVSNSC